MSAFSPSRAADEPPPRRQGKTDRPPPAQHATRHTSDDFLIKRSFLSSEPTYTQELEEEPHPSPTSGGDGTWRRERTRESTGAPTFAPQPPHLITDADKAERASGPATWATAEGGSAIEVPAMGGRSEKVRMNLRSMRSFIAHKKGASIAVPPYEAMAYFSPALPTRPLRK